MYSDGSIPHLKLVFTSYASSPGYGQPDRWLKRIDGYTGILEQLSLQNTVTGIERIDYEGTYERNGVRYRFIRLKKKIVYVPSEMHRLIKKMQPDVVFVNGLIFPLQVMQLRVALGRKVKIIIMHRAEKPFRGIKKYLQRLADTCVDAYLFTSKGFAAEWKSNIDVKRKMYEVIQASSVFHTMDKQEARHMTKTEGAPVFLWVGMLISRKDPLTVVKAFLAFSRYRPGARLYMLYQAAGLLDEINALLDQGADRGAIRLVGQVPHEELLYWYNSADFFITASHYEGSGVALSEAMSCGCIPVTSDFITFRKMTGDGNCGIFFETGNEQSLVAALCKTQELDVEKERLKVLAQFNRELSFHAIAEKITQVIITC